MRALIIVSILFGAATAHADEPPAWELHAFGGARFFTDSSAVTLATDPMGGGGGSVEREVAEAGPLALSAELGFDAATTSGTTFQQLDNDLSTWQVSVGGRARLPIFDWLHAFGRASVGGGRTHVAIRQMNVASGIADVETTFGAQAALGVSLLPRMTSRDSPAVFLGLDVELGYQATTAMTVYATPEDRPAPELTIPAAYASLGDLDLSGWTLRIGTAIGF